MVTNELAMTPFGAMMLMSTNAEDRVACLHCAEAIELQEVRAEPGAMVVACPKCDGRSLVVRLLSVLQRVVRLPGELWSQLQAEAPVESSVQTPAEVFSLDVSRGARVLLAMLWHRAEQGGSTTVEASMSQLARRLLSTQAMVRRWWWASSRRRGHYGWSRPMAGREGHGSGSYSRCPEGRYPM